MKNNEMVCMLDNTLSVWQNDIGYYWYDQFDRTRSSSYFETEEEAIEDCKDLIWGETA